MIVALRPLRRGDVQYRCSKVSRLRQRVDGVQLLELAAVALDASLCALIARYIVKKRKSAGQSRVYVTLGIIIA